MKLGILSRSPKAYSTHRLVSAAQSRGHTVRVLNTLRFAIDLSGGEPDLQYRGKQLSHYDAVLPRIGASITFFGMAVVRQFEQMDVYTPSTSSGIANSRDKLRSIQILSRHGIGIPGTMFVRDRADVIPAVEGVGGLAASPHVAQNLRAPSPGVIGILQDERGRALRHDEAIAVLREGPGGAGGRIVLGRQRRQKRETDDRFFLDRPIGAHREGRRHVAAADRFDGKLDG